MRSISARVHRSDLGPLVAVMVPGAVLALLSTTIVGVTVPDLARDLGVDLAAAQYVTSAYLLAAGIGIVVSGWAASRWGVRAAWASALTVFVIGVAASAVAPDINALVAARAVQGLGGGALEPIMLTAFARATGPERMGRVMGSVAAVMSVGPLIGPLAGGIVVGTLGWRWTFGVIAVVAALLLAATWFAVKPGERTRTPMDVPGLVLVSAASLATLFGLSRLSTSGGADALALGAIVVGVALVGAFVAWARHRGERAIVDVAVFSVRGYSPAVLVMALLGMAVYPLFFGLPLYLRDVVGLDSIAAGLLMIPYGVGTLIAMPITGRLSDRFEPRYLVWVGAALGAIAFAVLAQTSAETGPFVFAVLGLLAGLGVGSIGSPAVGVLYRVLPPRLVPVGQLDAVLRQPAGRRARRRHPHPRDRRCILDLGGGKPALPPRAGCDAAHRANCCPHPE